VLLEFAFIVPILAALAVGTLEIARATMVRQILSEAARKGCRTAVLPSGNNASITQDVNDLLSINNLSTTSPPLTITVKVNGVTADASTAKQNDQISVKVSIPFSAVSWTKPIILTNSNIESVTLVMLRQG
jgi:Flp pilus assembly protein TadG